MSGEMPRNNAHTDTQTGEIVEPTEGLSAPAAKSEKLEVRELFSCGNATKNPSIRIAIARESAVCGEDLVGEIHVQSASVARGYFPDNREAFSVKLANEPGEWLATGDLGFLHVGLRCLFVTQNGELYVCGRAKDLLIVRGRNYYPQDIEQSCCLLPQVKPGAVAAIAVPRDGQESLVVVVELRDSVESMESMESIVTQLRQVIAEENGLAPSEIVVIRPKTIAKTTSGKISRHRVLDEYLHGKLQVLYRQQFVDLSAESSSESAENPAPNASKSPQSVLPSQLDGINTVSLCLFSHLAGAARRAAACHTAGRRVLSVWDAVVYGVAQRYSGNDERGFLTKSPAARRARAVLRRQGRSRTAVQCEHDV